MPVLSPPLKKSSIVQRSESLRSEVSDVSAASLGKRVSFNRDVAVKRIPRGSLLDKNGSLVAVLDAQSDNRLWINPGVTPPPGGFLLREAQDILKQVDQLTCSTSASPIDRPSTSSSGVSSSNSIPQRKTSRLSDFFAKSLPRSKKGGEGKRNQSPGFRDFTQGGNGLNKSIPNLYLPSEEGGRRSPRKAYSSENLLERSSRSPRRRTPDFSKACSKIKKPHVGRAPLNSIGDTPSNSVSSDGSSGTDPQLQQLIDNSNSNSPVSSISDPGDSPDGMNSYNSRVSSLVKQLSDSPDRGLGSSTSPYSSYAGHESSSALGGHNNNKPFSYTSVNSPTKRSASPKPLLKSPKEVIYAQVRVGPTVGGRPGDTEKRTIHTSYANGDGKDSSSSPSTNLPSYSPSPELKSVLNRSRISSPPRIIHHTFKYNENKENLRNREEGHLSSKPKVIGEHLSSDFLRDQALFSYKTRRSPSPSPSPRVDRSFYYGDKLFSPKGGTGAFDYGSSSREASPAAHVNVSSAKLVAEAERRRDLSASKMTSDFRSTRTSSAYEPRADYSPVRSPPYTPAGNGESFTRNGYSSSKQTNGYSTYDQIDSGGSLQRKKSKLRGSPEEPRKLMPNAYSKVQVKGGSKVSSHQERVVTADVNKKKGSTGLQKSSSSAGLFSTLMRRNKDKKGVLNSTKTPPQQQPPPPPEDKADKDGKLKRQRAKFLSSFLGSSSSSSKKLNNKASDNKVSSTGVKNVNKKSPIRPTNGALTDSELEMEEAERRRDGEVWSSGEEEFKSRTKRTGGGISRGKTYNFGDYHHLQDPRNKGYYDGNDSDYRKDLATSRYASATLGRPLMRSQGGSSGGRYDEYEDRNTYTKSLDRRGLRNRSPPQIIVTPNTPAVREEPPQFYPHQNGAHRPLGKKLSGLSKSSYELDHGVGVQRSGGSSKLRYFGETDMEEVESGRGMRKGVLRNGSYLNGNGGSTKSSHLTPTSKYGHRIAGPSSSLSSESENGSRLSTTNGHGHGGGVNGHSNLGSQRSVYLHAAAIADIPPNQSSIVGSGGSGLASRRTLSRDELSNYSGPQKQTRHLSRSVSMAAPWRPRHLRDKYEVNYGHDGTLQRNSRPPKPPRSPHQKSMSPSPGRAMSSESLLPREHSVERRDYERVKRPPRRSTGGTLTRGSSSTTPRAPRTVSHADPPPMGRSTLPPPQKSSTLSRSKSMPKDSRFLSGWWKRFKESAK